MQVFYLIWVIPCQINKEFWVTSRILTKLGVFVVPMVLTTRTNFWLHASHSFWFMTTIILNISWKIGPFWVTKSTIAYHCVIIFKQKFQQLKTVDRPFQWSINYGISTSLACEMSSLKSLMFNISKKRLLQIF